MNKNSTNDNLYIGDEIDLFDMINVLYQKKLFISLFTLIFGIVSIFIALSIPNKYTSDVHLSLAIEASKTSSLVSRYGGLASMAGIDLPEGESSKKDLALEILNSRRFISKFIENRGILIPLMASKKWDPFQNKLILDDEIYDIKKKQWVRDVKHPYKPMPSYQESYEFWHENIFSLSENKDTGFIKINITHHSPYIARDWALWLVDDLNNDMRNQDISEATKSLEYLYKELENVSYDELNELIYSLIEEDIKVLSMANTKAEYIFKIIDPPVVSEKKSYPSRALICILITLIGAILACTIVLIRNFLLTNKFS